MTRGTTDGTVIVSLSEGAARDDAGNDSEASDEITITIDTERPVPTISANATGLTNSAAIQYTVDFGEDVDEFVASDIGVSARGISLAVPSIVEVSAGVYDFTISHGINEGNVTAQVLPFIATDAAGNSNIESSLHEITIDRIAPEVDSASVLDARTVRLVMSEPVSETGDLSFDFTVFGISSGGQVESVEVSGSMIDITVNRNMVETDSLTVTYAAQFGSINDTATNPLADFANQIVTNDIDNTPPTIISFETTSSDFTNSQTVTYTVEFSESVTGFDMSGISVTGTSGATATIPEGDGASYTFDVNRGDTDGTVTASILAGAARDDAGNDSEASDPVTVTIDTIPPVVDTALVLDATTIRLVMSEPVIDDGDLSFDFTVFGISTGGQVESVEVSGSMIDITVNRNIVETDSLTVTYVARFGSINDTATNPLADFEDEPVTNDIDNTAPVPTVSNGNIDLTNREIIPFTVRFDEPVTGFNATDIAVSESAGVQEHTFVPANATVYNFNIQADDDGEVTVSILAGAARDGQGNPSVASNTVRFTIDTTPPTVTGGSVPGSNIIVLEMSEPVFDRSATAADFAISGVSSGPSVVSIAVSGSTITLNLNNAVTDGDSPTVSYAASSGAIEDLATNRLADFEDEPVTNDIDNTAPVPTVSNGNIDLTNREIIPFTVRFDEPVTGFNATGIKVSGSAGIQEHTFVPANATVYNFNIQATADGEVTVSILAGAARDGQGNPSVVSNTVRFTIDTTPPTVTGGSVPGSNIIALDMSEPVFDRSATATDFAISGVATNPSVVSIAVSGSTITLNLDDSITNADLPLVSYTGTVGNIEDLATNSLEDFTNEPVTNDIDNTAPPVSDLQLPDRTEDEDFEAFTIDLSNHFSDPDGTGMEYTVSGQSGVVTASVSGNTLTIDSIQDVNGAATLTISATDGEATTQDSFEMTVTPVNDAPVLSSPFEDITRNEDFATITIDPSDHFADVDGDALTYGATVVGGAATVSIVNNMLEISSTSMEFGSATITVTARDVAGETASDEFILTVDSVNDEPVLNVELPDRTEDEDFEAFTIDLSNHFSDPDGTGLEYTVSGQSGVVTATVSGNVLTIDSIQDVNGAATLRISATDGEATTPDEFVLTVTPVNDAPVLSSPFNDITRNEDFDLFTIDPSGNFTDVDGDELTYDATSDVDVVSVLITSDDMLEITATSMEFGSATITITATDGDGETVSDEFILTVDSVNDVPVLGTSLPDLTRDEDFEAFTIDLSNHFSDPDGTGLDYTVSGQSGIVTATVSGNMLTVESIQDVNGAATLRISATDGEATTQDEFVLTVTPVNDAPVLSSPFEDITRDEDFDSFEIEVESHFTDVDGDALTYGATSDVDVVSVRITSDDMLEITATSMEFGSATITVTATDGDDETASGAFSLTVDSVNDVPVLGTSLPDLTRDEDFEAFTIDLSNHFSDPDGTGLDYTVSGQSGIVTATVSGNMLTVESIQDVNGAATLRISATDGEATTQDEFVLTVTPVNDAPVLSSPFEDITRDEDFDSFEIEVESHFTDVDEDVLTYGATSDVDVVSVRITSDDMLEITATSMEFGSATITVTATDGDDETASGAFSLTVDSVNDVPVLDTSLPDLTRDEDFEAFTIDLSGHFSDPDEDALTYDVTGQDDLVTATVSGNTLTIGSIQDVNGAATLTITASDGPESIQDSFEMTVTPVNDPPTLVTPFDNIVRDEDFDSFEIEVESHFTDVDGDELTYGATSDVDVVSVVITNDDMLEITATSMEFGSATITVMATDGDGETVSDEFILTVDSVNDVPVLDTSLPDLTRDEDFEAFTIDLSNHFSDPDGNGLEYTVSGQSGVVTATVSGNTLTIGSIQDVNGAATLTITASDGPESIQDSFEMTVTPVNDPPTLVTPFDNIVRDEDFDSFEIEVESHFTDVDGDELTYGATSDVDVVSVVITNDDMLEITATSMEFGSATITVMATDGDGETVSDEFILTVDSVNDVPVLDTSLPDLTRDEDFEAFTIDLSGHFSDPDEDALTYDVTGQDDLVTATVSGNTLTIGSIQDVNGAATLTISATDGEATIQDEFVLTVTPVNDPPTLVTQFDDIMRDEDFDSFEIEVESHFTDVDEDVLTYDATSVGNAATVSIVNNMLEISSTSMEFGSATITVTARDDDGETASDEFILTVDSVNDVGPKPILSTTDELKRNNGIVQFSVMFDVNVIGFNETAVNVGGNTMDGTTMGINDLGFMIDIYEISTPGSIFGTASNTSPSDMFNFTLTYDGDDGMVPVYIPAGSVMNQEGNPNIDSNMIDLEFDFTDPTVTGVRMMNSTAILLAMSEPVNNIDSVNVTDFKVSNMTIESIPGPMYADNIALSNNQSVILHFKDPIPEYHTPQVTYTQTDGFIKDDVTNTLKNFTRALSTSSDDRTGDPGWRTKPTFGSSHITGDPIVSCGYSIDGRCTDVLDYHVNYTRQTIQTNSTHDFALKTYAQRGVKQFELAFSVPDIGAPINSAEAVITIDLVRNYTEPSTHSIDKISYTNKNNVIGQNATFAVSQVKCLPGDPELDCIQLDITGVLFREEMYHVPFAIHATDYKLRGTINYLNEGILVQGETLNELPVVTRSTKSASQSEPLVIQLTRTDKLADIWTDQFGDTWTKNEWDTWRYVDRPTPSMVSSCRDIDNRACDAFAEKLDWHTTNMERIRDALYGKIYTEPAFDDLKETIIIFDTDGASTEP